MAGKSLIGCPGLNGGKASDWPRLCHVTRGRCSIISFYNRLEYGDSVDGTAFPQSSEGNQLT